MLSLSEISPLLQVIFVDLILPGDNAIVVAMGVAGLPHGQRVTASLNRTLGTGCDLLRLCKKTMWDGGLRFSGFSIGG
jgi:hypothetical protein